MYITTQQKVVNRVADYKTKFDIRDLIILQTPSWLKNHSYTNNHTFKITDEIRERFLKLSYGQMKMGASLEKRQPLPLIGCEPFQAHWIDILERCREFSCDFYDKPFFCNVIIPDIKFDEFTVRHSSLKKGSFFLYDNFTYGRDLIPIYFFGQAIEEIPFAILSNGKDIFLSTSPLNIIEAEKYTKSLYGDVLFCDTTIGYDIYLLASREDVNTITIVEKSLDVVHWLSDIIIPQIPNNEKIKVIQADPSYMLETVEDSQYDTLLMTTNRTDIVHYTQIKKKCQRFKTTKCFIRRENDYIEFFKEVFIHIIYNEIIFKTKKHRVYSTFDPDPNQITIAPLDTKPIFRNNNIVYSDFTGNQNQIIRSTIARYLREKLKDMTIRRTADIEEYIWSDALLKALNQ